MGKNKKKRKGPAPAGPSPVASVAAPKEKMAQDAPAAPPPGPAAEVAKAQDCLAESDSAVKPAPDGGNDAALGVPPAAPAGPAPATAGGPITPEPDPDPETMRPLAVPGPETMSGCLVRFCWLFYGPAALFALACAILVNRPSIGAYDIVYAIIVVGILAARRFDDRNLAKAGRPVPPGESAKFMIRFPSIAAAGLALARIVGSVTG